MDPSFIVIGFVVLALIATVLLAHYQNKADLDEEWEKTLEEHRTRLQSNHEDS